METKWNNIMKNQISKKCTVSNKKKFVCLQPKKNSFFAGKEIKLLSENKT